jgi:polygalacturonase
MKPSRGRVGRIKFGTEASGGFRNCTVANCTFRHCRGLALEEVDGGLLENITIQNLALMDVTDYAIYLTTGKRDRTPGNTTPSRLRNILISNVTADLVGKMNGIQIMGLPEQPIENVRLENIHLTSDGGGTAKDAARVPKELGTGYPEPGKLGTLPAYGIFARHVKNLELANISCGFRTNELRSAASFADIQGLEIDNFKPQTAPGVKPAIFADDVKDVTVRNSPALEK